MYRCDEIILWMRRSATCVALVAGIFATAPIFAEPARNGEIAALQTLLPGQWSLRGRDATSPSRSLCIKDMRELLQIQHGRAQCSRFVISNAPNQTTVHYTCPGQGHGQTTLRVETSRLVQIDSQGVIANEPFAVLFEGRRTGECQSLAESLHLRQTTAR